MGFEFKELDLRGAFLIKSFFAGDNRGCLTKTFEKDYFANAGIPFSLNETFVSCSMKNVIRGLHFQTDNPQAKIVYVVSGRVWDVIVDLRFGSPTFKQWKAQELSADNHLGFYIPPGFAHGFASLEDGSIMLYQCDGRYDKDTDTGIRFDDPDIGVEWPIDLKKAVCSSRDSQLQSLKKYINDSKQMV